MANHPKSYVMAILMWVILFTGAIPTPSYAGVIPATPDVRPAPFCTIDFNCEVFCDGIQPPLFNPPTGQCTITDRYGQPYYSEYTNIFTCDAELDFCDTP